MVKMYEATEHAFETVLRSAKPTQEVFGIHARFQQLVAAFGEAYEKPSTSAMYIAGPAMAPGLNREALKDPAAVEKVVLRHLLPSRSSIWVGDVVAFTSPLARPDSEPSQNIMVRRIAALEGTSMVSEAPSSSSSSSSKMGVLASDPPGAEFEAFEIPDGHCWVLADNPDLKPPHVIDSRSFGFIPLSSIIGRVAYSLTNKEAVINSPTAAVMDDAIIEQEVLIEKKYDDETEEGGEDKPQP